MAVKKQRAARAPSKNVERSAYCRAFRHGFDGPVYVERRGRGKVWVAYLQCDKCDTRRVDVMSPTTCELLSRQYFYEDDYDGQLTSLEAKQHVFKKRLTVRDDAEVRLLPGGVVR
jgi:hypothetical protein